MLKLKVKINKVNNLTDARYFAAMGVHYLGFCCNPGTEKFCAPAKIKEIVQWVEGPKFVLEFDGWQEESEIHRMIDQNFCHAVHFGAFATYDNTFQIPVFKDYILENINESSLNEISFPVIRTEKKYSELTTIEHSLIVDQLSKKPTFLDIDINVGELKDMLKKLPVFGLILRGGEEERVGVKTFDELDEIFELLSD